MPDPDAYKAGGATGAMQRATQLANMRAANARRAAQTLRGVNNVLHGRPRDYFPGQNTIKASDGPWRGVHRPPMPPRTPKPRTPLGPHSATRGTERSKDLLGLGQFNSTPDGDSYFDTYMRDLNPHTRADTTDVQTVDKKTGELGVTLPGHSALPVATGDYLNRTPREIERFKKLSPKEQDEARKNVDNTSGADSKYMKTINHMMDLLKKDPAYSSDRFMLGEDIADAFKEAAKSKYFTNDDLVENPLLGALNDLSVWADFRIRVSEFADSKRKTGDQQLSNEDSGDGSFASMVDNNSFSAVTGPGNLSKWLVARDEHGLLQVVSADQWIQAKYARMRHDPKYAAQMITALAATSAYGSDSTANSQRTRLVIGRDGNPVKGFPSKEDLTALKWLANEVAILQNQGDEVAIDDSIAELTKTAFNVTAQEAKNGDFGGGYGGYGHGGGYGGGGYGGGGGGATGAVRYTDGTMLTSQVSSIARQRMGRELTTEEAAAFVAYYHKLEEQSTAQYYAGQSNTQLDPEGQAVAWVTSHFEDEAAQNQFGNLSVDFFALMGSSNPFGSMAS